MATINREIKASPEVISLLKTMGINIEKLNIKEIQTEVVSSDEVKKIVLPKGMDKLKAAKELEKQYFDEEQEIDSIAAFEGWNWKDVLVAIKKVTEDIFGYMNAQAEQSFFGKSNPKEIDIVVDVREGKPIVEKAFYGNFAMACFENAEASIAFSGRDIVMKVTLKRKYNEEITQYFNAIRNHLETASIYRGKSIVVTRKQAFGGSGYHLDYEIFEPKPNDFIILNEKEENLVNEFIVDSLDEAGKRCYLFTGNYGTGKTETALRVGTEAVKRGMSFFYVKDSSAFAQVLEASKKYQPCLIFMEDIDEIASGEERDEAMNSILNTLDGVQTKGNNLTVIFTTNHIDRINTAIRRPGRIDMICLFEHPDVAAKKRIYQKWFEGLNNAESIDYDRLAVETPNVQGAIIAEICKRAVKKARKTGMITYQIAQAAITSMEYQITIMKEKPEVEPKEKTFFKLYHKILESVEAEEAEVVD